MVYQKQPQPAAQRPLPAPGRRMKVGRGCGDGFGVSVVPWSSPVPAPTVVYEHRSRLERSLQKERGEHKKTKEGESCPQLSPKPLLLSLSAFGSSDVLAGGLCSLLLLRLSSGQSVSSSPPVVVLEHFKR